MSGYRKGFTLVEILVALTISSIIVLAINGAFRMGLRLWHQVEDARPFEEQGRLIINMLRSEIAGAYMPGEKTSGNGLKIEGTNKLTCFTTTPSYYQEFPPIQCARVTYEFNKGALIRQEELVAGEKVIGEPHTVTIAEGITSFSVRFGDSNPPPNSTESLARPQDKPVIVQVEIVWPLTKLSARFLAPVSGPLLQSED